MPLPQTDGSFQHEPVGFKLLQTNGLFPRRLQLSPAAHGLSAAHGVATNLAHASSTRTATPAFFARLSFQYVTPSQPQTGLRSVETLPNNGAHTPLSQPGALQY